MFGKFSTLAISVRVVYKTLAVCFFLVGLAIGSENSDRPTTLTAFSMGAAQRAIESGSGSVREIDSLGYISRIWAVLLDDNNDLILIGERDDSIPPLLLDDAVVALRTMEAISSGKSPGVSIVPPDPNKYSSTQNVTYFAGIDSTHYGRVCYEADLLLKHLGLGYALTGVDGFPSEWDLSLDNAKAGRKIDPWGRSVGMSWFFPLRVRMNNMDRCVTLTAVTMEVRTDLDEELMLPREFQELDEESLERFMDINPDGVSAIHARLFTQRYDKIAKHHPVLEQLRNLIALSGLMAELLDSTQINELDYWMKTYHPEPVVNPTEVPTLARGVNGVSHFCAMSGGILATYEAQDAFTDAVLSRKPRYLRQAVIESRPSPNTVSWIVPLGYGRPDKWPDDLVEQLEDKERSYLANLRTATTDPQQRDSGVKAQSHTPLDTPGWHPDTEGSRMLGFMGNFYFSTGGFEQFSQNGRFSISGADVTIGLPITVKYAIANRIDLKLKIPFIMRWSFEDRLTRLPGISEQIVAYAGGIESPIVSSDIQLFSGMSGGRWILPSLSLENSLTVPRYKKLVGGFLSGQKYQDEFSVPFGTENWEFSHSLSAATRISDIITVQGWGQYNTGWDDNPIGDRRSTGGALSFRLQRESGVSLGILLYIHSRCIEPEWETYEAEPGPVPMLDSMMVDPGGRWEVIGRQYLISLSFPSKSGSNSIYIGWYQPTDPRYGGQFILSMDLSGLALWDKRLWSK